MSLIVSIIFICINCFAGLYSTSDDLEAGNGQEGLDYNNNNNSSRSGASFTQNQRIEELSYIWNSIKGTLSSISSFYNFSKYETDYFSIPYSVVAY